MGPNKGKQKKMQAKDTQFEQSIEGKCNRGRMRNVILREHILIQNPLIQLEDKSLQCSENLKAMDRTKALRRGQQQMVE
jgi:hypothetical protein